MMTTRLLVMNSRGMPCRSRLRASECQATAFSSSVWHRHFEQPHAAAVGVEGIDVVDDDELVAVPVELGVHAERGGVALDPARLAVEHGPHRAALGQAPGADQDQQVEMPLGEGPEILLQPVVGREMQHLVRGVLRRRLVLAGMAHLPQSPRLGSRLGRSKAIVSEFRLLDLPHLNV